MGDVKTGYERFGDGSDHWIGVDFDGTLVTYDRFRGVTHVGDPIWPMIDRVKAWVEAGVTVKIFTARVGPGPEQHNIAEVHQVLGDWSELYIGKRLEATNIKDYLMDELYDDRAVQVEQNTGNIVGYSTRGMP